MGLLEARAMDQGLPVMAMLSLVAGIGWTVAQNVAAGLHDSAGNALISAGVPLAFIATFESLLLQFRRGRGDGPQTVAPATTSQPVDVPATLQRLVDHFGSERATADALKMSRDVLRARLR